MRDYRIVLSMVRQVWQAALLMQPITVSHGADCMHGVDKNVKTGTSICRFVCVLLCCDYW